MFKKNKKTSFKNVPGDIVEIRIRDWYGHTFYKNTVNTADKKAFANSIKTTADFCGLNIEIKDNFDTKTRDIIKRGIERDKEKVRRFFRKDIKGF